MTESKKDSEGEMVRERKSGRERKGGSERETRCYVQGKPRKIIRFFSRNFVGQKRMIQDIQNAKKIPSNNTLPGKLIIQNRRDSFPKK